MTHPDKQARFPSKSGSRMIASALVLLFILGGLTAKAQAVDCQKFKNGRFGYPSFPGKLSVRKGDVQESYGNGKLEMIWKVKWLTPCVYEMTCLELLVESPISKGDRIVATIVKTEGDCFTTDLMFYNAEHPEGKRFPSGTMCIERN